VQAQQISLLTIEWQKCPSSGSCSRRLLCTFTDAVDSLLASGVAIVESDTDGFKPFCNSQSAQLEVVHDASNRQVRAMRRFFCDTKVLNRFV
jgi:hypothetical protein